MTQFSCGSDSWNGHRDDKTFVIRDQVTWDFVTIFNLNNMIVSLSMDKEATKRWLFNKLKT